MHQEAAIAPWKQRFEAPLIAHTQIAAADQDSGLVVSNQNGVYELYRWQVHSGGLAQLTSRPGGTLFGLLAPNGRHVFAFEDCRGTERGHHVRMPVKGGPALDLTPDLAPYSSCDLALSRSGTRAVFTVADPEGYHVFGLDDVYKDRVERLQQLGRFARPVARPILSSDGELLVLATASSSHPLYDGLALLNARTGEPARQPE